MIFFNVGETSFHRSDIKAASFYSVKTSDFTVVTEAAVANHITPTCADAFDQFNRLWSGSTDCIHVIILKPVIMTEGKIWMIIPYHPLNHTVAPP